MQFNDHSKLAGQHAFLSASKYHWVNYDDQKLEAALTAAMAAQRGTALHQLAHDLIKLGVKLPATKKTLNAYVNDALGFRMSPEVVLYYSENAFGTADAIGFRNNKLRLHDLKTGISPTSVTQLIIYAALFCLEYNFKPMDIEIELRIYQHDDVQIWASDVDPIADQITHVMSKLVTFDRRITEIRQEALG
jgi:hypothetical protein